jgi:hypothetical protein
MSRRSFVSKEENCAKDAIGDDRRAMTPTSERNFIDETRE